MCSLQSKYVTMHYNVHPDWCENMLSHADSSYDMLQKDQHMNFLITSITMQSSFMTNLNKSLSRVVLYCPYVHTPLELLVAGLIKDFLMQNDT